MFFALATLWIATTSTFAQTIELCTDYSFKNCVTSFTPSDKIFIKATYPKPVGEFYKDAYGLSDIPSSGKIVVAIGKDENDENPIVVSVFNFFPSRFDTDKQLAFTLQIDEKSHEAFSSPSDEMSKAISFNSLQLMAYNTLSLPWSTEIQKFEMGSKKDWTVFIFFMRDDEPKEGGSKVFTYDMGNDRNAVIGNLNDYDKASYMTVKDNGITNATHQKYIDKIVFSNMPISASTPNESAFKKDFAAPTENIYARLYLKESMRNTLAKAGKAKNYAGSYDVEYHINGKCVSIGTKKITEQEANSGTSLDFIIIPKADDPNYIRDYESTTQAFVKAIKKLPAGKHKIQIFMKTVEYTLSGEFTITLTTANRDAFVKKYELIPPPTPSYSGGSNSNTSTTAETITLYNTGNKSVKYEIYSSGGGSRTFASELGSSSKTTHTVSNGTVIKVNGATVLTVKSSDFGRTFEIK